ncbi:MAG TPA: hypothetical protein VD903_16905 [Pseudonocardia sp.]|nr:hypothetical protein [Pseudonocardia sp.]
MSSPTTPSTTNGHRHSLSNTSSSQVTTGMPIAAPSGLNAKEKPTAVAYSFCGNQLRIVRAVVAPCGPSPRPNSSRCRTNVAALKQTAVAAVNTDHQATAHAMVLRGPNRSDAQPPRKHAGA